MLEKTLAWRNIKLVNYTQDYFEYVYDCYQDYESRYLFTNELEIKSKKESWEKLKKKLAYNYHTFMIVINIKSNLPIGFIYSYNYNTYDEYIYVTLFIQKEFRNLTFGAEAGILFFDYLFKYYPIRKVYCTVYDYNKMSIRFLKSAGFVLEGVLRKHRYYNGTYNDMRIMALYRDGLYKILEKFKYKNSI